MRKVKLCLFIIFLLMISACSEERWDGYVYPDRKDILVHHHVGPFESKENCREESIKTLKKLNAIDSGYSICGKNCSPNATYYDKDCEETARFNQYR
jgi:hypothetical protein